MKYLPLLEEISPEYVSSLLWSLSRPDYQNETTKFYCDWVQHPKTKQYAILLDEEDTQPIHPQAEERILELFNLVSLIVPEQEAIDTKEFLLSKLGQRINALESLPLSLRNALLTKEEWDALEVIDEEEGIL